MAYRWSLEGPAFEFPTPYGTENRILVWRGAALIGLAVLVVLVLSFVGAGREDAALDLLDVLPGERNIVPHLVGAMLLTALGALDLLQAAARRTLLLAPGQPASLVTEVAREGAGTSPGANALQRLLEVGAVRADEPAGPYEDGLRMLGPELMAAPTSLHAYLRHRLAHLALAVGLGLVLLMAVLAVRQAPALALVSLVIFTLCAAVLVLHLVRPHQPAVPPWLVAVLVLLAAAVTAAGALGSLAGDLPRSSPLPRLGLPLATGVLLASVALCELMGILAARAQLQGRWLEPMPAESATLRFDADPDLLLREVDLELQRQWVEGVPNRRYTWLPPQLPPGVESCDFNASVLEESQPLVPQTGRDWAPPVPQSTDRLSGLLWMDGVGMVWSLAGGVLWLGLAIAHMRDAGASWLPGAAGLACLLAGAYGVRAGHLLWSRIEVDSTLTWLDFKGRCLRQPDVPPDTATRTPAEAAVRVEALRLQARVAVARTVFYAAAPHGHASRVLLGLAADRHAAAAWVQVAKDCARQFGMPGVATPAAAEPPPADLVSGARRVAPAVPRPGRRAPGVAASETPPPRRSARFCPHCGTPVLSGARFCQQCGSALAVD